MSQNRIVTVPTFGSVVLSPDGSMVGDSGDGVGVEEEVGGEVEKGEAGGAGVVGGPAAVAESLRRCRRSACLNE
jgi:hypothetical protein